MDWYEDEVRALERSRANFTTDAHPAVFYGSSSIRLWTTLAEDLQEPCAVNAGFGGSTLAACAHFFDRIVPPLDPQSIVVYAGDNDLADGRSPSDVLASYRALKQRTRQRLGSIPLAFLSIKASPARFGIIDRIRETNRLICHEIAQDPDALYVDIFHAMLGPGGKPRSELFNEDGLHVSRAGYEVWTRELLRHRNDIFTDNCREIHPGELSSSQEDAPGVPQVVQPPLEP